MGFRALPESFGRIMMPQLLLISSEGLLLFAKEFSSWTNQTEVEWDGEYQREKSHSADHTSNDCSHKGAVVVRARGRGAGKRASSRCAKVDAVVYPRRVVAGLHVREEGWCRLAAHLFTIASVESHCIKSVELRCVDGVAVFTSASFVQASDHKTRDLTLGLGTQARTRAIGISIWTIYQKALARRTTL